MAPDPNGSGAFASPAGNQSSCRNLIVQVEFVRSRSIGRMRDRQSTTQQGVIGFDLGR
jgi:hypothetical protein